MWRLHIRSKGLAVIRENTPDVATLDLSNDMLKWNRNLSVRQRKSINKINDTHQDYLPIGKMGETIAFWPSNLRVEKIGKTSNEKRDTKQLLQKVGSNYTQTRIGYCITTYDRTLEQQEQRQQNTSMFGAKGQILR